MAASKYNNIPLNDTDWDNLVDTLQNTTLGHKHDGTDSAKASYNNLNDKPTIPVNLDDLSDVNVLTPSDNQALTWDNATSKWIPKTISGVAKESHITFIAIGSAIAI